MQGGDSHIFDRVRSQRFPKFWVSGEINGKMTEVTRDDDLNPGY